MLSSEIMLVSEGSSCLFFLKVLSFFIAVLPFSVCSTATLNKASLSSSDVPGANGGVNGVASLGLEVLIANISLLATLCSLKDPPTNCEDI